MNSKAAPIMIALFAILALGLAELLHPIRDSVRVDLVAQAATLVNNRSRIRAIEARFDSVRANIRVLEESLARKAARRNPTSEDSLYLVVDTHTNQLFVRRGDALLRSCVAATGMNAGLSGGGQRWFFTTPKGIMTIRDKRVDPIWIMPDWAFVEKGEPVPSANSRERLVRGHLGDYALILGGGIMIHGTTSLSALGRNATHGCIRLGAEDLRYVYNMTDVGTPVYIF